jgi:hypothetical protein
MQERQAVQPFQFCKKLKDAKFAACETVAFSHTILGTQKQTPHAKNSANFSLD